MSEEFRLLVCGSRRWPWPTAILTTLDRFAAHYGDRLVVIEGRARGADQAAHRWCLSHQFTKLRHRCHPVDSMDWQVARRARSDWWMVGRERNTRMLAEQPHQVIAFHEDFSYARGGTSDMCLKALLTNVPVWMITTQDLGAGQGLTLDRYPPARIRQATWELHQAGLRTPS